MKLLAAFSLISVALATQIRYDGYKVLSLHMATDQQRDVVLGLEEQGYLYMDPPHGTGSQVEVVVPPSKLAEIQSLIEEHEFKSRVMTEDLQSLIDGEGRYLGRADASFGWKNYYPLENIYSWLDEVAKKHPKQVTPLDIGKTYEGRPIKGVKISYRSGNPGIFIESNIHAREWVTSAVSTWVVNLLLTSNDTTVRNLRETIDWYVVPVANPDGFAFTHSTNRLWRKTRSPSPNNCFGADPNRNFDYLWSTGGSSSNPCSDTYAGSKGFSEKETKALADFYSKVASNITGYIDFHSFSQLLMYPYGSKAGGRISNEKEHITVGKEMQTALARKYGTVYKFGDIVTTIYEASGGSIDWVKGVHDTPFVYVYELRDTGKHGFLLPAEQIVPNAEEVWDSLVTFVSEARKLGYFKQ